MPLAKGFLQARIHWDWFSRWAVGVFAIIGISYSFSIYAFAVVVREVMRFFTAHLGLHEFLQLTKDQEIFYNFWLAELALVFGLATVSQPLVLQLVPRGPTQQRLTMSHDQHSLMWFGLFALAKTMVLYGMLAPVIPIFLSFEFYQFKVHTTCPSFGFVFKPMAEHKPGVQARRNARHDFRVVFNSFDWWLVFNHAADSFDVS